MTPSNYDAIAVLGSDVEVVITGGLEDFGLRNSKGSVWIAPVSFR